MLVASSLFSVEGKVALLTGASGFLGRTFGETLLANGADLVVLGRPGKLSQQAKVWSEKYGSERVHSFYVDMYDSEAFGNTLDEIGRQHAVDVLINNAHELAPSSGFNTPAGSLEHSTMDVLDAEPHRRCLVACAERAEDRPRHERPRARKHHQHFNHVRVSGSAACFV